MLILGKASKGEIQIMPGELLKEVGIVSVSLANTDELRKRAREEVIQEIKRRKYDRDRDVRSRPEWPEDKPLLVIAGESGQGKTSHSQGSPWISQARTARTECYRFSWSLKETRREIFSRPPIYSGIKLRDHDEAKPLDRVASHWREIRGNPERPWLAVCIDGVQSLAQAKVLIDGLDWERWGIRLALSVPKEIGARLANERPDQVQLRVIRDFTLPELREYLQRQGRSWETVPADVRDVVRRPLLAGLYSNLGSDPEWAPIREYELYEKSWQRVVNDLSDHPQDLARLKRLALTLLSPGSNYPWTQEQVEQAGLSDEQCQRLERAGWWIRNDARCRGLA